MSALVPHTLPPDQLREVTTRTRGLLDQLGLDTSLDAYSAHSWHAEADAWPALHLEDISAIPFVSRVPGVEVYQQRARVRARDGDLFASISSPPQGYESYCQQQLGLGRAELIEAERIDGPMAVAKSCMAGKAFDRLCERATENGAIAIHPYMGIQDVWDLAAKIGDTTRVPVRVLGPPAPITWVANDKKAISELTAAVAGPEFLVETVYENTPDRIARALVDLATRHRDVALKRTRCASAMGNRVFSAKDVHSYTEPQLLAEVAHFLQDTEWPRGEPVLVVSWEDAWCSPSTQLWIPRLDEGPPRLDGIYQQLLEGEAQVFLGSRPSELGPAIEERLAWVSLRVGRALQTLGYVGRCSFDFLVVGDATNPPDVRLTECNGRWGGTSTPMSLVDRLFPNRRPMYRAQDFARKELVGMPFLEMTQRLGSELFDVGSGTGRFVLYNVGCIALAGKFDVIAFGDSSEDADRAVEVDLPKLLGVPA